VLALLALWLYRTAIARDRDPAGAAPQA
jgi:hypothetical protein